MLPTKKCKFCQFSIHHIGNGINGHICMITPRLVEHDGFSYIQLVLDDDQLDCRAIQYKRCKMCRKFNWCDKPKTDITSCDDWCD